MVAPVALAVENNAMWCGAVCSANGIPSEFVDGWWLSRTRTPDLYPDAVTLDGSATSASMVARIDTTSGASVKDSFASLDLGSEGFSVLFEAQWIGWHVPRKVQNGPTWQQVATARELGEWVETHPDRPPFPAALLADERVTLLRAASGSGVVGCALYATSDAVGVTNVFATDGCVDRAVWSSVISQCGARYPRRVIVGYETGERLAAAVDAGAEQLGHLRIWIKP